MNRKLVLALAITRTVDVAGSAAAQNDVPTHRSAQAALRYFESVPDADFGRLVRQLRRAPPSAAVRERVIRSLPKEGELVPTPRKVAKLVAIRPVLAFHGRSPR